MPWMVHGYDKDGSALTHEVDLDEALHAVFKKLLHQSDFGLLGCSFPLEQAALDHINQMLDLRLDSSEANYFLDFEVEYAEPPVRDQDGNVVTGTTSIRPGKQTNPAKPGNEGELAR